MTLIILGLILWIAGHQFKRLAPGLRARLGERGKGVAAVVIFAGLLALIFGYRGAEFVPLYTPVPGIGHLNNTLMLVAIFLYGVGGTKGVLYPKMRHPMLWGTVVWSVAHLLVNGDLASVVMFGGIGLWALLERGLINASSEWVPPTNGRGIKGDAMNLVGTLALYGAFAFVHGWLGHPVFLGTYY